MIIIDTISGTRTANSALIIIVWKYHFRGDRIETWGGNEMLQAYKILKYLWSPVGVADIER